jgi:2-oxoglutarate dehydrogenase E1 component
MKNFAKKFNISNNIQKRLVNLVHTPKFSFLSGNNTRYIEQMHEAWQKDPSSVHVSWKSYFENVEQGLGDFSFIVPPTIDPSSRVNMSKSGVEYTSVANNTTTSPSQPSDSVKIYQLIRAYQKNGYLKAKLDPLGFRGEIKQFKIFASIENLDYRKNGFVEGDLEKEFIFPISEKSGIFNIYGGKVMKLKELIAILEKIYCGSIGIEYKHISSRDEVDFLSTLMEKEWAEFVMNREDKIKLFKNLSWATKFETFCEIKFTTKRFGIEGLETVITGMKVFFEKMSDNGVKDITLGMAHRGRLNILANLFDKPINNIFKEFQGKKIDDEGNEYFRSGDVKYHLGYSTTKQMDNRKSLKLEILPNPSHLECINPIVQGKVRAKQHYSNDSERVE